jgi:hypothetical protein
MLMRGIVSRSGVLGWLGSCFDTKLSKLAIDYVSTEKMQLILGRLMILHVKTAKLWKHWRHKQMSSA